MNWKDELEEICGEEYIEAVEELIESLLKKQRENCAREAKRGYDYEQEKLILNAPEPGGSE